MKSGGGVGVSARKVSSGRVGARSIVKTSISLVDSAVISNAIGG